MGRASVSGSPRSYFRKILTPGEAEHLHGISGKVPFKMAPLPFIVEKITALYPGFGITPKSYARIEQKNDGHTWHVDTGDMGHMPWCRLSASIGLSRPDEYSGGEFQFYEPFEEIASHFCDAIIYTSAEVHRVLPHDGCRKVLLVFLGEKDGE